MVKKTVYKQTRLEDYTPPAYLVDTIELVFRLKEKETIVQARYTCRRNPAAIAGDNTLNLSGEHIVFWK